MTSRKTLVYIRLRSKQSMVYELIVIAAGVIIRISEYLYNRSLWLDESSIALEIVNKSLLHLFKPLGLELSAPIGFLILEKLSVLTFGIGEQALRLFPLILGLGSIWLFFRLCKKILSNNSTIVALFLFSFSEPLIYYSAEVKQYIFDVFVSLILYIVFIWILERKKQTLKEYFILAIFGGAAVYFSQPSVFILAAIGTILLIKAIHNSKNIYKLLTVSCFWIFNAAVNYYFFIASSLKNTGLNYFWSDYFAPFPSLSFSELTWYKNAFIGFFTFFLGSNLAVIGLLLFTIGTLYLIKKNHYIGLGLILPLFFVLAASALHLYPFGGRLVLFLIPAVFISIGIFFENILENKHPYILYLGIALLVWFFAPMFLNASYRLFVPRTVEEVRPLVQHYQDKRQKNDIIYLYYGAKLQFEYYSELLNLKKSNTIYGVGRSADTTTYLTDIDKLKGHKRVWFLFSHVVTINNINERDLYLYYLNRKGKLLDSKIGKGASIYLYDLSL